MADAEPTLRIATPEDASAIETLMRVSGAILFRRFYDEHQAESAVRYVSNVDPMLLEDRTYFVIEAADVLVACGGWSRRDRLYTGSGDGEDDARLLDPATEAARIRAMFVVPRVERRGIGRMILQACEQEAHAAGFRELELMAMLSGHAMYLASGYRDLEEVAGSLEDGTPFPLFRMRKRLV